MCSVFYLRSSIFSPKEPSVHVLSPSFVVAPYSPKELYSKGIHCTGKTHLLLKWFIQKLQLDRDSICPPSTAMHGIPPVSSKVMCHSDSKRAWITSFAFARSWSECNNSRKQYLLVMKGYSHYWKSGLNYQQQNCGKQVNFLTHVSHSAVKNSGTYYEVKEYAR